MIQTTGASGQLTTQRLACLQTRWIQHTSSTSTTCAAESRRGRWTCKSKCLSPGFSLRISHTCVNTATSDTTSCISLLAIWGLSEMRQISGCSFTCSTSWVSTTTRYPLGASKTSELCIPSPMHYKITSDLLNLVQQQLMHQDCSEEESKHVRGIIDIQKAYEKLGAEMGSTYAESLPDEDWFISLLTDLRLIATRKASIVAIPDGGRSIGWSIYGRSHGIRTCAFCWCLAFCAILCVYCYIKVILVVAVLTHFLHWFNTSHPS